MASFLEELWNSVFTPGPTPTLLVATNATFAALQFLLLVLLLATYSIHFLVLSLLSAGLWYSINWFARELQAQGAKGDHGEEKKREKSPDLGSETETEDAPPATRSLQEPLQEAIQSLRPPPTEAGDHLRKRRSLGDNSGYVSTDSEWEKVSEGEEKAS